MQNKESGQLWMLVGAIIIVGALYHGFSVFILHHTDYTEDGITPVPHYDTAGYVVSSIIIGALAVWAGRKMPP